MSDLPLDAHHEHIAPEGGFPIVAETSRIAIGSIIAKEIPDATLYFILAHEIGHAIQEIPKSFVSCAASSRSRAIVDIDYKNPHERQKLPKGAVDFEGILNFERLVVKAMQSAAMADRTLRPGERVEIASAFKKATGSAVPHFAYTAATETTADYLATQALVRRIQMATGQVELQRQYILEAISFFPPSSSTGQSNVIGVLDPHANNEHRVFSIVFANRDVQAILGCGFADAISAPYDCSQPDATQSLRLMLNRFASGDSE